MKVINDCEISHTDKPEVIEEPQEQQYLFVKKTELARILEEYAKEGHTHSPLDMVGIIELLEKRAKKSHTHNAEEILGLSDRLAEKANAQHGHTIDKITGLPSALNGKASVEHTHLVKDIKDLGVFTPFKDGLVPKSGSDGSLFLSSAGTWKRGLSLNDVATNINDMLPTTALRWPSYLELRGNISDVLPAQAKRWPSFQEVTGDINSVLPSTAKRWPTFSEIGGNVEDILPADFNDPIEFGDIVGDVDDILPETAKRWPTYDEIEGEIESQLTDHALRWPSWLEVTGDIRTVLPEQGKRWPYYTEILGDIEDYLPETALRWPRFDEILGSFLGLLPETAIRWPTLQELGITNVDGAAVFDPGQFETESPTTPFNFTANAGIDFVLLSWNVASYNGHAYTEVYRFTDDVQNPVASADINDAVKVGETTGFIYTDQVDVGSAHYYWIRFVNTDGEQSPFTPVGGLYAQTSLNYDALIGKARQDVLNSLEIWKNSIREATDILDNEHFTNILNLQGTMQTLSDQVLITENRLDTKYEETVTITENRYQANVEKIEEMSASIFETDEDGNYVTNADGRKLLAGSFITSVDEVTATEIGSIAESQKQLAAVMFLVDENGAYELDEDGNPILSGGFSESIERVTSEERSALASKITNVSASIFAQDDEGNILRDESGNPLLTGSFSETVNAVSADEFASTAARIDEVSSSIFLTGENGNLILQNGQPVLASAFIDKVDATLAASDGELMAAIGTTLGIERDGVEYKLSEIMSLALDTEGKFEGQWGVKTTINDLQYGAGFVARTDEDGNVRTGFHVAADTFSVHNPANGEEVFPLIVDEFGNVLINTAVIDKAVISDLVAERIVTGDLFAGKSITSPVIRGGEIEIGNKFSVDSTGNVNAKGITIRSSDNKIILSSGNGIDGAYIKNLSVDSAAIKGQAITSPHSVEVSERELGRYDTATHEFGTGKYIGGGIQFSITFRALNVSSSRDDESLVIRIGIYDGDTELKGYDFQVVLNVQGLYETSTICGMFSEDILEAARDEDLVVKIDLSTTGLGNSEIMKYSMTGFILYAKK